MPDDPLLGNEVEKALGSLPAGADPLTVAARLRRRLEPDLARRAAELHELRVRAVDRFPEGHLLFMTRKGLEQASAKAVADARAQRLGQVLGLSEVWDATCGVGSDSLALAAAGHRVVASDLDPIVARFARENLSRAGHGQRVIRADATRPPVRAGAVLLDPDRRPAGRREGNPEAWAPSLSQIMETARAFPAAALKLPPALDPGSLPLGPGEPRRLQWVSLTGELRELCLWLGEAVDREAPRREALALDGRGGAVGLVGEPEEVEALEPAAARAVPWLAEPDPALLRAGLLGLVARQEAMAPLAPRLAYLGGERAPASPLLRAWPVLGTAPLDRRRVRSLLAEHDVGPLTVKKRGHPDPAHVLARRLRGPGTRPGLLAVARLERGHLALLLGDRTPPRGGDGGR